MRLIPPETAPTREAEAAPLTLTWNPPTQSGGHSSEYLLGLPCITGSPVPRVNIPDIVEIELQKLLGDEWWVSNRGTRVEISSRARGTFDHPVVMGAVQTLFNQLVEPYLLS